MTYTVRLARSCGTVASYSFNAANDDLNDAGLLRWLTQFRVGAWPFSSVLEDGIETGLSVPPITFGA